MDSTSLLQYLSMVSNKNLFLNMGIHLLVFITIAAIYLLKDMKAKKCVFNGTILVLFLSVTINAVIYGNPFHAITFGIMTVMAGIGLARGENRIGAPQKNTRTIVAFIFVLAGLWYPEFVEAGIFGYLIMSPVGVVPCPTLITALGMLNLYYPDVNKKQFIVTVFFGIVYGFIGTFKLGVYLDLFLIGTVVYSIYNMIRSRSVKKIHAANQV